MLFQNSKRNHSIQRVHPYQKDASIKPLVEKIKFLEKEIAETNKAIFEAQLVKIRSLFSQNTNILIGIQKKLVESNADKSIRWHLSKLFELKKEQTVLQNRIDKLTGKVWPKRISKLLVWLGIMTIFLVFLSILIIGIFAAVYLLPIIGLIILAFIIYQKIQTKFT